MLGRRVGQHRLHDRDPAARRDRLADAAQDRDRSIVVPVVQDELEQVEVAGRRHRCEEVARGRGEPAVEVVRLRGAPPLDHLRQVEQQAARVRVALQQAPQQAALAAADVDRERERRERLGGEQPILERAGCGAHRVGEERPRVLVLAEDSTHETPCRASNDGRPVRTADSSPAHASNISPPRMHSIHARCEWGWSDRSRSDVALCPKRPSSSRRKTPNAASACRRRSSAIGVGLGRRGELGRGRRSVADQVRQPQPGGEPDRPRQAKPADRAQREVRFLMSHDPLTGS